jgi:hypothetical protein
MAEFDAQIRGAIALFKPSEAKGSVLSQFFFVRFSALYFV